jgi:hypothetical protein
MPGAPTAHTSIARYQFKARADATLNAVGTTTPLLCAVVDYLLLRHVATLTRNDSVG